MSSKTASARPGLLLAAALAAGQLALLGPVAVWSDNREAFAGLSVAVGLTLGLALLALFVLFAAPGLLVPRLAGRLSAALFTLTLLMWKQSFLSNRLLTGQGVAGSASGLQQVVEGVVWLGLLVAAVAFAHRLRRILPRAVVLVIVVQILTLVWAGVSAGPQVPGSADGQSAAMDRLATLSSERNVILLVLDGTERDFVTRALESHVKLASGLAGFRVFTDHLATFPTTRFSIPAMLSGSNYDNTVPAEAWVHSTLADGDSAPRRLQAAGWDVGLASTIRATLDAPADTRVVVEAYVRNLDSAQALGLELLDLSAFRHLPARLGEWVYNNDEWRLRQLSDPARKSHHAVRSRLFIEDYVTRLRVGDGGPAFRFIHIGGAHPPVVVDSSCHFLGVQPLTAAPYAQQVECALRQATQLVDRLRDLGILDRTFIVVASDHGVGIESEGPGVPDPFRYIVDRAAATMMIKDFDAQGPLTFDSAPTSIADLPAILARAIDASVKRGDYLPPEVTPERVRSFFFHEWQNEDWRKPYLTALHGFRVRPGSASDDAWSYAGTEPSPEMSSKDRSRLLADAANYFGRAAPPHPE